MPFNEEFIRSEGIKKIITIIVRITKVDEQQVKSIVETDQNEMDRVDFMEEHIKVMESVNSAVFDKEILKKSKPMAEIFKMPENKVEIEFFTEVFRCLQVVTVGYSLRVLCDVCAVDTNNEINQLNYSFVIIYLYYFSVLYRSTWM